MTIDTFTLLEIQHVLVIVRIHRLKVSEDKMRLEERLRLGWDGSTTEAILACANELYLLNSIIVKLWRAELTYKK